MTVVPIIPKKLPTAAATFPNGSAPVNLLRDPGDNRGALLLVPSYGSQALRIFAAQHGFDLRTTGRGRTLDRQIQLLQERYDRGYIAGRADYNVWRGETWSLKPGMAMAAVPGTSNHGWWCADDLAEQNDLDPAADPLSPELLEFLIEWAPQFGWGWETSKEPWHVHWIAGDVIPPLAQQVLAAAGIDFPGRPVPPEDDMTPLPTPERAYDSRPTEQAGVNPTLAAANKAVPLTPWKAGEQRAIVIGMAQQAFVQVTVIGAAPGYVEVAGVPFTKAPTTSIADVDADGVTKGSGPVATPEGRVYVWATAPCDIAVDVRARA